MTAFATLAVGAAIGYAALRQAAIARQRHEEQTKADLQRRITESFTKAVEQLGNDKLTIRLGGIYTLERISKESPGDYWTVMETLTGFVREHARWKGGEGEDKPHPDRKPPTDVAAVLAVIMRRSDENRAREEREQLHLDLSGTDLRGANLYKAHLERADLSETHLEDANLREAHLGHVNLRKTHLESVDLYIEFEGADLYKAHLESTNLYEAHLERADLSEAHLEGANLSEAHLEGTSLHEAHLEGADLQHTEGLTQARLNAGRR